MNIKLLSQACLICAFGTLQSLQVLADTPWNAEIKIETPHAVKTTLLKEQSVSEKSITSVNQGYQTTAQLIAEYQVTKNEFARKALFSKITNSIEKTQQQRLDSLNDLSITYGSFKSYVDASSIVGGDSDQLKLNALNQPLYNIASKFWSEVSAQNAVDGDLANVLEIMNHLDNALMTSDATIETSIHDYGQLISRSRHILGQFQYLNVMGDVLKLAAANMMLSAQYQAESAIRSAGTANVDDIRSMIDFTSDIAVNAKESAVNGNSRRSRENPFD